MKSFLVVAMAFAPALAWAQGSATGPQSGVITLSASVEPSCSTLGFIDDITGVQLATGVGQLNTSGITSSANNRTVGPITCNGAGTKITLDANPLATAWSIPASERAAAVAAGFTNAINYTAVLTRDSGTHAAAWPSAGFGNASTSSSVTTNTVGYLTGSLTLSLASPTIGTASTLISGAYQTTILLTIEPGA